MRTRLLPQSHHLKPLLGLDRKAKLPAGGMEPRSVNGVIVWIEPLLDCLKVGRKRRMFHRVKAACPICREIVSAGRLHQHMDVHK